MSDQTQSCSFPIASSLALRQGFRMQYEEAQECDVLLFPEGMIKLSESAGEILKRCDGSRNLDLIVADLEAQFPGHDLRADVIEFLNVAWTKGWLAAN